ncbi:MAG: PHP domain-containing protein [Anaerolineales bacterium]
MKDYRAELHVHTILSPCAGVEMIPPLIVEEAVRLGLQVIAITDHNATANIGAVMQAAQDSGLVVLPGMELQTREEVHLLCLFDSLEQAAEWQGKVDAVLPNVPNDIEYFGEQFVVDASGEFIRREERLLLNSVQLGLEYAAGMVRSLGGLAIPAHVDRKANGLLAILGLVPAGFEALEISRHISPEQAVEKYPQVRGHVLLQGGDVHYLDGFLGAMELHVEKPCIAEIAKAIKGEEGRKLSIK